MPGAARASTRPVQSGDDGSQIRVGGFGQRALSLRAGGRSGGLRLDRGDLRVCEKGRLGSSPSSWKRKRASAKTRGCLWSLTAERASDRGGAPRRAARAGRRRECREAGVVEAVRAVQRAARCGRALVTDRTQLKGLVLATVLVLGVFAATFAPAPKLS